MKDIMRPFWDPSLAVEKRIDWLLSQMTVEEKLKCLSSGSPEIERLGIPAMLLGGEAAHGVEARNDQNDLGAPEPTTSFVQPIGMSASFDTELIRLAGEVTGTEARVIYHRHPDRGLSRWAPTVDLERDPRWGRNEEGYGEDPFLTGEMASAYVRGMQGDDRNHLRIAATLKHFYGNNTEDGRGWKNSSIDPRNKYELYLEPFRRVIEKGRAEAVMTAYNKINGVPGMLNHEVQDILKDQYGLKHAVSDGGATALVAAMHHYYGIHAETVAAALKAGVDTMSDNPQLVEEAAREAWELGLITEEEIDRSLRNTFGTKLRLGVYDAVTVNPYDRVGEEDLDSGRNREICMQMSREAVVLMKNERETLPLTQSDIGEIALIGPMADVWYQDWYGGTPPFTRTLKEGIEGLTGSSVACVDGYDRVILRCGEKGVAVREDGTLFLSDAPDVFVKQDWGEGSISFRCERTGKYMNMRLYAGEDERGHIAAEKDSFMDWFVMEIFHIVENGDGSVTLTDHIDNPIVPDDEGSLWTMREGKPLSFTVEVQESGLEAARRLAAEKGTVVLALGCNSMVNARETTDRETIALPPEQERLLEEVSKVNPNTVLVLLSNYPYAIGRAREKLPAILWSATGAQDMGDALAETLFGKNAPAGRLNETWYVDDSALPDINDYDIIKGKRTYRYFDGEVLYPFGHGLTYTDFTYDNLQVRMESPVEFSVRFTVTNTGGRTSDEVAQVYGIAPASRVKKPLRQLLGFARLKDVKPGEARDVEICVPVAEFEFYDVIAKRKLVESGSYRLFVGPSSAEAALEAVVEIAGEETPVRDMTERTAADHYDDYENIELVEGRFGYTAAVPKIHGEEGLLCYRDCLLAEKPEHILLYLKCETGGSIRVSVDGEQIASWEGNTREYERNPFPPMGERAKRETAERGATWRPIYAEVELPLAWQKRWTDCPFELRIALTGDIRLCYFKIK